MAASSNTVRMLPDEVGVVLPLELRSRARSLKFECLPPSVQIILPVVLVDLVDGPGVAGGDQQVAVGQLLDRVQVEVIVTSRPSSGLA